MMMMMMMMMMPENLPLFEIISRIFPGH